MALKLYEFQEQFLMGIFLMKLTQFEKTRTLGSVFVLLENLEIKFHFDTRN